MRRAAKTALNDHATSVSLPGEDVSSPTCPSAAVQAGRTYPPRVSIPRSIGAGAGSDCQLVPSMRSAATCGSRPVLIDSCARSPFLAVHRALGRSSRPANLASTQNRSAPPFPCSSSKEVGTPSRDGTQGASVHGPYLVCDLPIRFLRQSAFVRNRVPHRVMPLARTRRLGTGSRSCGCASTGRLSHRRQGAAAQHPAPDARVLPHHMLGFLWRRRNPQTRGSKRRTS